MHSFSTKIFRIEFNISIFFLLTLIPIYFNKSSLLPLKALKGDAAIAKNI